MIERFSAYMKRTKDGGDFRRDPGFVQRMQPVLDGVLRYFRAEVEGERNLPAHRPVLLVGNHSGGLYTPEVYVIMGWWLRHHGPERPLYLLAHDILFALPVFGRALRRVGGLPANWDNARAALGEGHPVLVMPGGDYEAFRPWRERARVDFGGRTGFVKLALRANVPIVPVVSHGSHDTTFVITRGERIARALKLNRIRAKVMPLVLGLPWGVVPGFVPTIPIPARISVEILEPIEWPDLDAAAADDPAVVASCYDEVVDRMQESLAAQFERRPWPVWNR